MINSKKQYFSIYLLSMPVLESTTALMRCTATSSVSSLILAKQTRNHPGSLQWHEDPGETLSPKSDTTFFQSSISASKVSDFSRTRISTQQNNPALLLKHGIPDFMRPEMSIFCLFLSLSLFSLLYLSMKGLSARILERRNCDCEEISPKLDILVAADIKVSLLE